MAKGGARARSGPAPDPNALARERDRGEWSILPAEGRQGPAPAWPLPLSTEREMDLWSALWAKPQAIMWDRLGLHDQVALYVRRFVEAEEWGSTVNLSTLVRQMADSLGLTVPGMRANRWHIEDPDAPSAVGSGRNPGRRSSRGRLKVVDTSDVEGA